MLEFNETNHTYTFDGKVLISTTQLMRKHNLSPNYDMVNPEVLQSKAKKGTLIHKEIENFIKENQLGFTDELYEFQKYVKEHNLTSIKSEAICLLVGIDAKAEVKRLVSILKEIEEE